MSELDTIAATFGSSEPVFKISAQGSTSLYFDVKNQYVPIETNDPVQKLMAASWHESLNKQKGRFEPRVDIEGTYRKILSAIGSVIVGSSPLKNPKQSRLFKWFNNQSTMYNDTLSVGYIALYRYIIANGIKENRDNANPYAKNVLAILELMREKYEDKSSSH